MVRRPTTFESSAGSAGFDWVDGLISEGSKIVLGYVHPHFGQFPAVVTTDHQASRITTVGTLPNAVLAADLIAGWCPGGPGRVCRRQSPSFRDQRRRTRIHIVHNLSWTPQRIGLPHPMGDLLSGDADSVDSIALGAWDVRVLAE